MAAASRRSLVVPPSARTGLEFNPYKFTSPFESYKPLDLPCWARAFFHVVRILNLVMIASGFGFFVIGVTLFGHAETNPIGLSFGVAFILLFGGLVIMVSAFLLGPTICCAANLILLGHQKGIILTCYMIFLAILSTETFTASHLYLSGALAKDLQTDLDATMAGWSKESLLTVSIFLVALPLISIGFALTHKLKVYYLQQKDTSIIAHLSWSHAAAANRANNNRRRQPFADPEFAASLDLDSEDEVDEIIEKYFLPPSDDNPPTEVSQWLDAAKEYSKPKTNTKT